MTDPAIPADRATRADRSSVPRWILVAGIAIVLVFVAAMVTQVMRTRGVRADLAAVRAENAQLRTETQIGAATAEALQGRYEPARVLASRFFTALQERMLALPAEERGPLQALLDRRDATITLLSRGDPAAGPALVRLVTDYRALGPAAAAER